MRGRLVVGLALVVLAGVAGGWAATTPRGLTGEELAALPAGDAARGERVFWAGGCTSCHAAPGSDGDALLRLAGGLELATPFGVFVAPNISQDPDDGIGAWSLQDFANAMLRGVSPGGRHYYPAFPYGSYARMDPAEIADLHAFMKTLPAAVGEAAPHRLSFPASVRRGVGLWKLLHLNSDPVLALGDDAPEELVRGRSLVEGAGHCGECHTPRDVTGGLDLTQWMAGGPAPEGDGNIPDITPSETGIGGWSQADIAYFLESGFTPDFDTVGGSMAAVQKNMARLPPADRAAIAAYLKAIPAR